MTVIDEAITFLRSCDTVNVSEAARRFSVDRSTPSKRVSRKTGSKVKADGMKPLLTNNQELILVKCCEGEVCLVGHHMFVVLYSRLSNMEAVLRNVAPSLHLTVVYTTCLLCIPSSSYCYRETMTYRKVISKGIPPARRTSQGATTDMAHILFQSGP
jgi:hypothetical protein